MRSRQSADEAVDVGWAGPYIKYPLRINAKVKELRRQPGATRISSKNQVTIPVQALAEAGLAAGDVVWAEVVAPGVVQLVSAESLVSRLAGAHTDAYAEGSSLDDVRDEWDR